MTTQPNFSLFIKNLRIWLTNKNNSIPFVELNNMQNIILDSNISLSAVTNYKSNNVKNDKINLMQQFYINSDINRQNEIKKTLLYNCYNNSISKIYLLNERLYTDNELGVKSNKIIQIVIGKRMMYSDVFKQVKKIHITGYIIISNSDIFFDASLTRLYKCELINQKKVFALNRFDYKTNMLDNLELDLEGRPDCQDTWIYHSKYNDELCEFDKFNIELGKPGCDNRIMYLFITYGFKCHNEPYIIKTYHYHRTQIRNYDSNTIKVEKPYYAMFPVLEHEYSERHFNKSVYQFNIQDENYRFGEYIREKINDNIPIIIPNIIDYESDLAIKYITLKQSRIVIKFENFKKELDYFKTNTNGMYFSNIEDIKKYSDLYMSTFDNCDTYFWEAPWSKSYSNSHYFIEKNFEKNKIWSNVLNLDENKHINFWCKYLDNKKILIVTNSHNSIDKYGEFFPNSEILFLELSENKNSVNFIEEYYDICKRLSNIKDTFEIALITYPGFNNIIKSYLFNIGKSCIYSGR